MRDHITNDEVLRIVDLGSLSEIVRQRRLRFAGHILPLPETRPAYMAMNWQPDNGRRRPGRPTKTWRTTFNEDLHEQTYSSFQMYECTFVCLGLHGWVQRDLPATDRNGESSSPDVPANKEDKKYSHIQWDMIKAK